MADVAVVTDSVGYLPVALTDSLGITVMSQYYDLGSSPSSARCSQRTPVRGCCRPEAFPWAALYPDKYRRRVSRLLLMWTL
jgi:hypothetical protein